MKPPRLLVRVSLHIAMIFLAAAFAIMLVGHFLLRPALQNATIPIDRWVVDKALERGDSGPALQSAVDEIKERIGVEITILDARGHVAATANPALLDSLVLADLNDLLHALVQQGDHSRRRSFQGRDVTFVHVHGHDPIAFALVAAPLPPLDLRSFAVAMCLVLVFLALGSFLLVKNLTKPLTHLAAAARAFGRGNFAARAKIARADEIGDLANTFDEMAAHVQRMRLAEKELLANISHELRTPLARIRVVLELAEDQAGPAEPHYFREITTDLEEIEHLLDDIIEVARFELVHSRNANEGAYPKLRIAKTSINDLVGNVVERFRAQHPRVNIDVNLSNLALSVRCDPAYVRRVVANLLANAVHHGQGRGLRVTVRDHGPHVEVRVRDEGPGIAEADFPKLFTPFFRTDASRSRNTGGFGLGLALCKRIIEAHGGKIELTSREGAGTEVCFTLPAEEVG